ncbi:MAG: hypothetical protein K0U74_10115 [Alphaproteobacteria bacterium]|nr:hypothetical protein [Alphaproteobacteria bacterium]
MKKHAAKNKFGKSDFISSRVKKKKKVGSSRKLRKSPRRRYRKLVKSICKDAKDAKSLRLQLYQLIGYLLDDRRDYPVVIILVGRQENGISALLQIIKKLLGKKVGFGESKRYFKSSVNWSKLKGLSAFIDANVDPEQPICGKCGWVVIRPLTGRLAETIFVKRNADDTQQYTTCSGLAAHALFRLNLILQ